MGGVDKMKFLAYISILIFISLFKPSSSYSAILTVGKGKSYSSIQSALKVSQSGDQIWVYPGNYKEKNLVIDKSIILKGFNFPVLDGESKFEIISITADDVIVEGFKLIKSGVSSINDLGGIKIYDSKNVIIRNNNLEDTFFGIYIQYGINCKVLNNNIRSTTVFEQNNGNGIHAWKSDSLIIKGNVVNGHRDGVYLEFTTNSIISENLSLNNLRYGLHFMFCHYNHYYKNVFSGNGAGVAVMYSRNVEMYYNVFRDNWGDAAYGLLLKEITDSKIENNRFNKNTIGIYLDGSSRVALKRNEFINNGWAMKLMANCMEVDVRDCNFLNNTFDIGTNGSLVLNHLENNYWDKYEGYDLNKDKIGDIPYRPVSLYSMVIEKNPPAMILLRSFMVTLLDKTEKIIPTITPENLKDDFPRMKPLSL